MLVVGAIPFSSSAAEMDIADELRVPQRSWTQPRNRSNIQRFEHGINGDAIAGLQAVVEANRPAIHEDQVDFRVRHTHRLDRILHRWRTAKRMQEGLLATFLGQEVVQLLVETKLGFVQILVHRGSLQGIGR